MNDLTKRLRSVRLRLDLRTGDQHLVGPNITLLALAALIDCELERRAMEVKEDLPAAIPDNTTHNAPFRDPPTVTVPHRSRESRRFTDVDCAVCSGTGTVQALVGTVSALCRACDGTGKEIDT